MRFKNHWIKNICRIRNLNSFFFFFSIKKLKRRVLTFKKLNLPENKLWYQYLNCEQFVAIEFSTS